MEYSEKPEPNAYWHEKHGWITGLPSVRDSDFGAELSRKVSQLDKQAKAYDDERASGPRIAAKMLKRPDLRNIYSDTNEENDVINPADFDACNQAGRYGSFSHGNSTCGCQNCD